MRVTASSHTSVNPVEPKNSLLWMQQSHLHELWQESHR
jgi:hypothetical protein